MSDVQIVAVLVLAIVAIGILWFVRMRHREFNIVQLLLWFGAKLMVRVLWRAKYSSPWPIPRGQGAIVACNHRSSVDPFFLQASCDHPMRWMVAREYLQAPVIGWFLRMCNVIPVGRGGIDTAATKTAIRFAASGGQIGLLPEGRINTTDQFMLPVRPGAVLVALRARVPILPCYIEGSPTGDSVVAPLFKRARVRVTYGKLMDLSPYYGRESEDGLLGELVLRVAKEIAALAGQTDFQPQLAGRRWKVSDEESKAAEEGKGNGDREDDKKSPHTRPSTDEKPTPRQAAEKHSSPDQHD